MQLLCWRIAEQEEIKDEEVSGSVAEAAKKLAFQVFKLIKGVLLRSLAYSLMSEKWAAAHEIPITVRRYLCFSMRRKTDTEGDENRKFTVQAASGGRAELLLRRVQGE